MKIKKPTTVKAPGAEGAGGAAIADRFKLDSVETTANRAGTVSKKSAMTALIFGLIALGITVALTLTIYKHWEYLMPA
jgi:hypothetical protein